MAAATSRTTRGSGEKWAQVRSPAFVSAQENSTAAYDERTGDQPARAGRSLRNHGLIVGRVNAGMRCRGGFGASLSNRLNCHLSQLKRTRLGRLSAGHHRVQWNPNLNLGALPWPGTNFNSPSKQP